MFLIIYTPTRKFVMCYSSEYRRPNDAVYLSIDHPEQIEEILLNTGATKNDIDLINVTDSQGIFRY
ncbi:hypothetical protein [Bacillus cereus]|uniref:hypothetical protein n=1 Tax=Bacillus cereus TaxID=1396 RepID=UPI00211E3157|nr:hypothetical protein [Bacillus cereus]